MIPTNFFSLLGTVFLLAAHTTAIKFEGNAFENHTVNNRTCTGPNCVTIGHESMTANGEEPLLNLGSRQAPQMSDFEGRTSNLGSILNCRRCTTPSKGQQPCAHVNLSGQQGQEPAAPEKKLIAEDNPNLDAEATSLSQIQKNSDSIPKANDLLEIHMTFMDCLEEGGTNANPKCSGFDAIQQNGQLHFFDFSSRNNLEKQKSLRNRCLRTCLIYTNGKETCQYSTPNCNLH